MIYFHKVGSSRTRHSNPKLWSVNSKVSWVRPPIAPQFSFLHNAALKPPSSNKTLGRGQDPTIGQIRLWICA